jgi:hypothetical protein
MFALQEGGSRKNGDMVDIYGDSRSEKQRCQTSMLQEEIERGGVSFDIAIWRYYFIIDSTIFV